MSHYPELFSLSRSHKEEREKKEREEEEEEEKGQGMDPSIHAMPKQVKWVVEKLF